MAHVSTGIHNMDDGNAYASVVDKEKAADLVPYLLVEERGRGLFWIVARIWGFENKASARKHMSRQQRTLPMSCQ
jgi:hypothetical protein